MGTIDGKFVGELLGCNVGRFVVGDDVGSAENVTEGEILGAYVGRCDGDIEGEVDGAFDGF